MKHAGDGPSDESSARTCEQEAKSQTQERRPARRPMEIATPGPQTCSECAATVQGKPGNEIEEAQLDIDHSQQPAQHDETLPSEWE